jgi:7-carboxy-7-deazaguanine synthase (Cx14CxxC type)
MAYSVKEIFYTLQGEGIHAGRPAVFCRFSGCNLWNGREEDRTNSACWFCDTDFIGTDGDGGGSFSSADSLADAITSLWPNEKQVSNKKFVVFTGGEPLLQLDLAVIKEVKARGFQIAVETNGTLPAPEGIDWLTVSPKPKGTLVQKCGSELKLVYPQDRVPEEFENLEFEHFLLSPLTSASPSENKKNLQKAIDYCANNPRWRLTMQYHKIWGLR